MNKLVFFLGLFIVFSAVVYVDALPQFPSMPAIPGADKIPGADMMKQGADAMKGGADQMAKMPSTSGIPAPKMP